MRCADCGQENPEQAKFCLACAAPFALRCANCGTELPPNAKFCFECAQPAGHAAPTPERAPRDYTPKHLADKILQSKSALEGERKQVTVLFADVKGSLEPAEQVDPEEWHRILDRFFQILADGVHRFEGTINQYTGDGIMALFGAPIAHEDHAQRACWAALYLRDELRRYADDVRRSHGLSFSVRMGLNSGGVVVGRIGDDLRMDYTAQGHTVGLAQRIEQLAPPESPSARISASCRRSSGKRCRTSGCFPIGCSTSSGKPTAGRFSTSPPPKRSEPTAMISRSSSRKWPGGCEARFRAFHARYVLRSFRSTVWRIPPLR